MIQETKTQTAFFALLTQQYKIVLEHIWHNVSPMSAIEYFQHYFLGIFSVVLNPNLMTFFKTMY